MMTAADVYDALGKFNGEDAEEAARAWVLEHASEFPDDIRDDIVFQFSVKALVEDIDAQNAVEDVQKQGVDAMDAINKAKGDLENEARIIELKEQLKQ